MRTLRIDPFGWDDEEIKEETNRRLPTFSNANYKNQDYE